MIFNSHDIFKCCISGVNNKLPDGFIISGAEMFFIPGGKKKHSLSSLLWGFAYDTPDQLEVNQTFIFQENSCDYIKACDEKKYRELRLGSEYPKSSLFQLNRCNVLAKNITGETGNEWIDYFSAYRFLYGKVVSG